MRPLRFLAAALSGLVVAGLTTTALVAPADARPVRTVAAGPKVIALPDGFQPEGIAIGPRLPIAFLGSRVDGDIYAADLRTGRGRVISQGPGTPSLGIKVFRQTTLLVAGGTGGDGRWVDAVSGDIVRSWQFTSGAAFVNDVVITPRTAWFTDSANARLYGVPIRHGKPAARFTTLPLTGDWDQIPEQNNANGIVRTPDGRGLIIVNSTQGLLYRVNPHTGVAKEVDLGGYSVEAGDGLLLRGRTLYVVQNRLNRIAVIKLDRDGRHGRFVRAITSPRFDVPSTVARYGDHLYLPNARFTTPATPTTTYEVTRVRASQR